ncbi:MAG: hypothetical protein ABI197_05365, partial [Granulicella sp.]
RFMRPINWVRSISRPPNPVKLFTFHDLPANLFARVGCCVKVEVPLAAQQIFDLFCRQGCCAIDWTGNWTLDWNLGPAFTPTAAGP